MAGGGVLGELVEEIASPVGERRRMERRARVLRSRWRSGWVMGRGGGNICGGRSLFVAIKYHR